MRLFKLTHRLSREVFEEENFSHDKHVKKVVNQQMDNHGLSKNYKVDSISWEVMKNEFQSDVDNMMIVVELKKKK